jgi:hypothetical protein
VITKTLRHIQGNAVAYVALFFAIGGGGAGAAIAATAISSSSSIHACVSKTSGALYVAKHCTGTERALSFNQRGPAGPAGPTGVVAYGQVDGTGVVRAEQGMTITETSTGMYNVAITARACKKSTDEIPAITPVGLGALPQPGTPDPGNVQPAVTIGNSPTGSGFQVLAGYLQNGMLVHTTQGFDILDVCGNYSQ